MKTVSVPSLLLSPPPLTWAGLAPADRASFAWRLLSFDHLSARPSTVAPASLILSNVAAPTLAGGHCRLGRRNMYGTFNTVKEDGIKIDSVRHEWTGPTQHDL